MSFTFDPTQPVNHSDAVESWKRYCDEQPAATPTDPRYEQILNQLATQREEGSRYWMRDKVSRNVQEQPTDPGVQALATHVMQVYGG